MASFKAYTHNGDAALLRSLGLKVEGVGPAGGYVDLGTVVVEEARTTEFDSAGKHERPAATVKVEANALPAQFFRFTVTRPRDEMEELGGGRWRPVYEPVEVFEIRTGSGSFGEYWPMAKAVAQNCFNVREFSPLERMGIPTEREA